MEGIIELIKQSAELGALFLAYVAVELVKRFKQTRLDKAKEKKSDPTLLMKKKNDIENCCVVILDQTKASHVAVWRLHNGEFYSGGDSIKKLSMYTEAAVTDSLRVDTKSQELPLKNFSKTFMSMAEAEFVSLQQGECADWHMNKFMHDRGYHYMICVLLHTPNGPEGKRSPIGMLCISYLHPNFDFKTINSHSVHRYKKDLEYKIDNFENI